MLLIAVLAISLNSYGQFTFGVSPGMKLNTAYFGYNVNNKFVPYIGIQNFSGSVTYSESGKDFNWDNGQVEDFNYSFEAKGRILVPQIGLKYFVVESGKLKAFANVCLSKPIVSAKVVDDGEEYEDVSETAKSLNIFGGELGFGTEYFFDEHFSVGGEFGLRFVQVQSSEAYDSEYYNPDTDEYEPYALETTTKVNMSPTFSKVSLNFYF